MSKHKPIDLKLICIYFLRLIQTTANAMFNKAGAFQQMVLNRKTCNVGLEAKPKNLTVFFIGCVEMNCD